VGTSIEEAQRWLSTPIQATQGEVEAMRSLIGAFEGPEDLAERARFYLYGIASEPGG
jgi:hypothetical protein